MRKLILLAAMAAMTVPSTAIARPHNDRNRAEVRKDKKKEARQRNVVRQRNVANRQRVVRQQVVRQRNVVNRQRYVRNQRIVNRQRVVRNQRYVNRQRRHVAYSAPYRNWRYNRVNVGFRLRPVFYSPRYYINDYGYYRLPPPRHYWLRWIRYGDDLLLVNIRTGRVLDVVHYRYW